MKKVLIVLLVICMCMMSFAACKKDGKEETPKATQAAKATDAPKATEASKATQAPQATPTAVPTPTKEPGPKTVNVAAGKTATADNVEGEHVAANAVDEDYSTRWSGYTSALPDCFNNFDRWLMVDLGKPYTITSAYITWESLMVAYRIVASDTGEDGSWVTVYDQYEAEGESGHGGAGEDEPSWNPLTARYVKILTYLPEDLEATGSHPYCSIYEFELYGYEPVEA